MVFSAVRINAAPSPWPIYFYRRVSPRPATRPREIITKPFIFCRTVTVLITRSVRNKAGINSEEKTPLTTVNILRQMNKCLSILQDEGDSHVLLHPAPLHRRHPHRLLHAPPRNDLGRLQPFSQFYAPFGQRANSRKSCLFSGNSLDVPSANRVTFCRNLAQVTSTFIVRVRSILFIALMVSTTVPAIL